MDFTGATLRKSFILPWQRSKKERERLFSWRQIFLFFQLYAEERYSFMRAKDTQWSHSVCIYHLYSQLFPFWCEQTFDLLWYR